MILKFPDLDTLRVALTTGAVPAAVSQSAAVAGFDDQGPVWVETSARLPRGAQDDLKQLGVQFPRKSDAGLAAEVSCWPELLPLVPDPAPLEKPETVPVLFDLPGGEGLARLITEILRLGNDRQGFRWLEAPGKNGTQRALLRVVGPPYYSLLRALDHRRDPNAPVAFVERAPGVWVEFGYTHPLAGQIKPPKGKLLFLRPPRQWSLLAEGAFRDVYEVLEFTLPDGPSRWKEGNLEAQIKVAPSLRPGGSTDGAELWVLRESPIEELNRFVQNADDQMLHRLAFAVGDKGGQTTIVLRVRQSKLAPPELVLKAQGYKHYLKLPNLFLPVGTRLHPPLRRDVVRKLLADDTSVVTWLTPGEDGTFTPESLPEDSFRPLWDWIDYVLDHDREALQAWVQASQFDFEPFICDEEPPPAKPRKPPGEKPKRDRPSAGSGHRRDLPDDQVAEFAVQAEEAAAAEAEAFTDVEVAPPNVLEQELRALEGKFIDLEGDLDAPERLKLWPELASRNAATQHAEEAGVCWLNAMWEEETGVPEWDRKAASPEWAWAWFRAEASDIRPEPGRSHNRSWATAVTTSGTKTREVSGEDLDRLLGMKEPGSADVRALAAYLVWSARRTPPPGPLVERLNRVQRFLEQHERMLPVRAHWLAWSHVVKLSRGDVLALARARDRLLERLFTNGLRPEQDLPSFLRFAGSPTNQRFRAVRQWLSELHEKAQEWAMDGRDPHHEKAQTFSYVELIFSFGLARLGEMDASRALLNSAKEALGLKDDAHKFLLQAFEYRIRQALEGKPHTGPLPDEYVEYMEEMDRLLRYVADRLRKHSRVLEPDQRINPYRHWGARINDLEAALVALTDLTDRQEIVSRVDRLLKDVPKGAKGHEVRAKVLRAGLEAAPRVNEDFARRLLDQAVPAYDALPENPDLQGLLDQAAFLEKALFLAAHYGSDTHIHPLVARFEKMLHSQRGPQGLEALNSLAGQCFRGLRKLGMRDEIDRLLGQMAEAVLEGKDLAAVDFQKSAAGPDMLKALLQVAAGWYYFGRDRQAEPVLQAARALLLKAELPPRTQTALACAYAQTVGQAPVEVAQKRLEEIFTSIKGVTDSYTTSSHFSVSKLDVIESVVLAVVSDDFTLGTQARRWLDDDEFLVRRRVHGEYHKLRAAAEHG